MEDELTALLKLDKAAFPIATGFDESEERVYWLSRTPEDRLQHVEILRRINGGDRATAVEAAAGQRLKTAPVSSSCSNVGSLRH